MRLLERTRAEFIVLRSLARGLPAAGPHGDRLDAFYGPQARHYDRFRERLLHGRDRLLAGIDLPEQASIVELGGGTGRLVEYFGDRIERIARYRVVDLCRPLLEQAAERARRIPQLQPIHADATTWRPGEPVDVVIVSYALTMIPDWRAAIGNACAMLRSGGMLAVVDFYLGDGNGADPAGRHGWLSRRFWRGWFGHDGVQLDGERIRALCRALPDHRLQRHAAGLPYLPMLRAPYYLFWGRKP